MRWFLGLVFRFLGGVDIKGIAGEIARVKVEAQNAETDQARIAKEEEVEILRAQRDVQIAEAGNNWNRIMRALLAVPVVILLWKIIVWDKALGQWTGGVTGALDSNLWIVVSTVLGFYFLDRITDKFKRG